MERKEKSLVNPTPQLRSEIATLHQRMAAEGREEDFNILVAKAVELLPKLDIKAKVDKEATFLWIASSAFFVINQVLPPESRASNETIMSVVVFIVATVLINTLYYAFETASSGARQMKTRLGPTGLMNRRRRSVHAVVKELVVYGEQGNGLQISYEGRLELTDDGEIQEIYDDARQTGKHKRR